MDGLPDLISISQASTIAGIHKNTGFRLVESGEWPAIRIGPRSDKFPNGKLVRLSRTWLNEWIKSRPAAQTANVA